MGLGIGSVTRRPLRVTEDGEVLPGEAYRLAAQRGYRDAVCTCTHVYSEHEPGYGCHKQVKGMDGIECPCIGFVSAAKLERDEKQRRRRLKRRWKDDYGAEAD